MSTIPDGPRASFGRVLAVLEATSPGVRVVSDWQIMFRCRSRRHANGDRNPSGSATYDPARGSMGVFCHAGCDVMDAHGIDPSDLFDFPIRKREHSYPPDTSVGEAMSAWLPCGHSVGAAHNYTDPAGRFLAQKLRCSRRKACERGRCVWRRLEPTSGNGWKYNRQDRDVRLYRPDLIRWAIANEMTLWLVEGESDADALISRRIPATTAPDGAWTDGRLGGKWKTEYTELLRGAFVFLCGDRDPAGKAHVENVANEILPVVASLDIVVPAAGKDIRDHFDAGLGLGDLVTVATPKPFVLNLDQMAA